MNKVKFLFLLFFLGCNLSDDIIELPNGYVYASESQFFNEIEKCKKVGDSIIKITIPSCIIKYKYNERYIIALQKPFDDSEDTKKNIENFNKIKINYYWVIDTKFDYLFGPITLDSFNKLSKKMYLPVF